MDDQYALPAMNVKGADQTAAGKPLLKSLNQIRRY